MAAFDIFYHIVDDRKRGGEAKIGAEAATDLSRIAEIRNHPILSPGTATRVARSRNSRRRYTVGLKNR
jgi:hypothetical protein